jgi:hypothetical protein
VLTRALERALIRERRGQGNLYIIYPSLSYSYPLSRAPKSVPLASGLRPDFENRLKALQPTPQADISFLHDEEALEEEASDKPPPPSSVQSHKRDTSRTNSVRRVLTFQSELIVYSQLVRTFAHSDVTKLVPPTSRSSSRPPTSQATSRATSRPPSRVPSRAPTPAPTAAAQPARKVSRSGEEVILI